MNKDKFLWHLPVSRYKTQILEAKTNNLAGSHLEDIETRGNIVSLRFRYNHLIDPIYLQFHKQDAIYKDNTVTAYCNKADYIKITCLDMPIVQEPEVLEELQKINAKLDKIIEGRGYG